MDDPNRLPETEDGSHAMHAVHNAIEGTVVALDSSTRRARSSPLPAQIGRYRIVKVLGEGAFGLVYLGYDEELKRQVALKVPRRERVSRPSDVEAYLVEAQTLASLDHPAIVPVHDVGRTDDGLCYVVSKFIEGTDLQARLERNRLTHHDAADLVATIADALHYAHTKGLVHRDVKPANILIDSAGKSYVTDFGLALKEEDIGSGSGWAGTPNYMSPEQARGEGHRVDGRSDIFSVGVIFYEMLAGTRPFRGDTSRKLLEQISSVEARPLRQRDANIPPELERICLKALSKKASDRYTAAKDLADDLRHFLSDSPRNNSAAPVTSADSQVSAGADTRIASGFSTSVGASESQVVRVVPKGLRSFDAKDADFFLELLPGPRDRDGLPDGIRFWKDRIEETDADETFGVGLIYGPSGCGKSSMVKAGLLPRLSEDVLIVYVEATADETETRLLHGLCKRCSGLPDGLSLKDTLTALRRGQGVPGDKKVLIVLDQFEQWLHAHRAHREGEDTELVAALRQCDGSRVQVIVMVRDDFWLAVSRFMKDLEIRLLEGHNSALVDLFDADHARRVLTAFGRAFGRLPERSAAILPDQTEFLRQSITGLAEEGKVICVRLALFADMLKGKPWTPATLKAVGGTTGVGMTFLEETFSASTAPPEHRYHQKAARNVLTALLPESGTDIKGHMRSSDELLQASGYARRPADFQDLISILDGEIRLVTPTDSERDRSADDVETPDPGQKYYQLTHDYLVPSLRDWLTRKQRETRKGRAELRLAERAALWNAKQENRHLPSWWEHFNIRLLTSKQSWAEPQRRMMIKAGRVHGVRWGTALAVLLVVGIAIQQYVATTRQRDLVARLDAAVATMGNAPWYRVPDVISDLKEFPRDMVVERLKASSSDAEPGQKRALAYALAACGEGDLEFLLSSIAGAPANECGNIVAALDQDKDNALKRLSEWAKEADANADWRRKGRLAVVALHLGDATLAIDVHKERADATQQTVFIHDVFPSWHGDGNQLAEVIDEADDAALRSGMCLAMGNLPNDDLGDAKTTRQELLAKWYRESPDSGTHGAAGWALRQWKSDLPEIPPTTDHWKVTPHGLTLILISAGQFERTDGKTRQTVTLTRDVWLSDVEVSVGLFQQFMNDESFQGPKPKDWNGVDENISPTSQHPAQQVNSEDAVLFCNWLSQREGRSPCYKVEPLADADANTKSALRVELLPDGTGYRLPTEAEWEYACRAGTTTDFCCGDDAERLIHYAVIGATKTEVPATKMCNRWGLFDMHGNVYELCYDRWGSYVGQAVTDPIGLGNGSDWAGRGGSWLSHPRICQSGYRGKNDPTHRYYSIGFRVAQVPLAKPGKKPVSGAASDSR